MKTAESVLKKARDKEEPVLILRAQDRCALAAIDCYIKTCKGMKANKKHLEGLKDIRSEFERFRYNNKSSMKVPD